MQYGSGEMVSIPMENDKRCQGYYVLPQNHKGALSAGVILLHDAMAFLKSHNVGYADNIAGEGYQVVIPEYIEPSNVPKISIAHVKDFSQWKSGFDAKSVFEMIVASATYLRSKGVQTIGIVGLGFGAEVGFQFSMECGKRIDLRMMAGICPTGLPTCALVHGKFKLYCFLGGMEGFITNDELQEFKNNATELGLDTLIKKYPRMGHGYAYSCIMNEDTAVATISEVLDALQLYLIDFKAALGTSDNDQWYETCIFEIWLLT